MSDTKHPNRPQMQPLDPVALEALLELGVAAGNRLEVDEPLLAMPVQCHRTPDNSEDQK
jgi:hypothetical protein